MGHTVDKKKNNSRACGQALSLCHNSVVVVAAAVEFVEKNKPLITLRLPNSGAWLSRSRV